MPSSFLKNQLDLLTRPKEMEKRLSHWSLRALNHARWLLFLNLGVPIGASFWVNAGNEGVAFLAGLIVGCLTLWCSVGLLIVINKIVYKCLGLNSRTSMVSTSYDSQKKLNLIEKLEKYKKDLDSVIFEKIIKIVAEKNAPPTWWWHLDQALVLVEKDVEENNALAKQKVNDDLLLAKVEGLNRLALEQDQSSPLPTPVILSTEKISQ